MNLKEKLIYVALSAAMLTACQQGPKTYAYLMSHPNDLKEVVSRCQSSRDEGTYCQMAFRAGQDFDGLYNQWRMGPEKFGKSILDLEMGRETVFLKANFSEAMTQKEMIAAYLAVVGVNPVG